MATERRQVYQCGVCGNRVEVVHAAGGTLVCCNQPMNLLTENTTDAAQEKHVPVIAKIDGGIKVQVGSVAHPMDDDHYIEWIEAIVDDQVFRQFLSPGDAPEATFPVEGNQITARAFCNLHGLWKPSEKGGMEKFICAACGYLYDPEKGDPESRIQPGTAFPDLPDDWGCPGCGVGKDFFLPE